jgi:hypothetical protein
MSWNICVHPGFPIVEIVYTGVVTPQELSEAIREALSAAHEKGLTRILSDCSALRGGHSVFDLFTLADDLKSDRLSHVLKDAIIIPDEPESVELVRFWETTCINRGISARIFSDRQSSIDWLMEG